MVEMKRLLFVLTVIVLVSATSVAVRADFPSKPIKIIVHTKPGGAVDLMARQLAQVASKYCDQPLAVINKPGGSGLLALASVYKSSPDGHILLAFPAAFLAPIQTTDIGFGIDSFHYIACMTISPEVIITNKHSDIVTMRQILDHAKANPGEQKWCGPGSGSLDHLMGVKIWNKADISVKWIPYGGGGPAIVAVMGKHNDVYVGNPEDILGRESKLTIAAVASSERLPNFPEAPTFSEYDIDLTDEVMWRGFAVQKDTPAEAVEYLEDLLWKCSQDSLWLSYVEKTMVQGVFMRNEEFTEMVKRDAQSSQEYLKMAGFKIGTVPESAPMPVLFFVVVLAALLIALVFVTKKNKQTRLTGTLVIATTGFAVSVLFYYMSLYFPDPRKGTFVGAGTIPQFWAIFLAAMAVMILWRYFKTVPGDDKPAGRVKLVAMTIAITAVYTILLPLAGFYPATLFLLAGGMIVLGYRKYVVMVTAIAIVLLFMYFVFSKLLMVPLPTGILF